MLGEYIYTGSSDKTIKIINSIDLMASHSFMVGYPVLALAVDSQYINVAGETGYNIYDTGSKSEIFKTTF